MTTESIKLELEPRMVTGKKVKQLRRDGTIPVHLYGPGEEPRSLQCENRQLLRVLALAGSTNPVNLTIKGERGEKLAFAREIQWSPVRSQLLHVDFLTVSATERVTAQVPINLVGESPAARETGGSVAQTLYNLDVEALPLEIPNEVVIDLSQLVETSSVVRAGDLSLESNVTMLTDPDAMVVRVDAGRLAMDRPEAADGAEAAGVEASEEAGASEDSES